MEKKVMNSGYDLTSSPMLRVFWHYMRSRCVPMGNLRGGAGLKCLIILSVTHYLGRPLFWCITRFEPQMARIYKIRERIIS